MAMACIDEAILSATGQFNVLKKNQSYYICSSHVFGSKVAKCIHLYFCMFNSLLQMQPVRLWSIEKAIQSQRCSTTDSQKVIQSFPSCILQIRLVSVADLTPLLQRNSSDRNALTHTHTELFIFVFSHPHRLQESASVCLRRWETKKRGIKKVKENVGGVSKNSKRQEKK